MSTHSRQPLLALIQLGHSHPQMIGPWRLGKTLGRGSTGRVLLATHQHTGQKAAVKVVLKRDLQDEEHTEEGLPYGIEREIIIMKLLTHPNVLRLYDVWETLKALYLVLEYVEGGELFDLLVERGPLPEQEAVKYFRQIILGTAYCHALGICHRDLKPENLLLDASLNVKLADFGMAALEANGKLLETLCGLPHYAAPEIVSGLKYHGAASDVWLCGVILFALLTGRLPFDDETIRVLLLKVQAGAFEMPAELSPDAQDLITAMLTVDPQERISVDQVLQHPLLLRYPIPLEDLILVKSLPHPETAYKSLGLVKNIDPQILANLLILWKNRDPRDIVASLLAPGPGPEKTFYALLMRYRHGSDDLAPSSSHLLPKKRLPASTSFNLRRLRNSLVALRPALRPLSFQYLGAAISTGSNDLRRRSLIGGGMSVAHSRVLLANLPHKLLPLKLPRYLPKKRSPARVRGGAVRDGDGAVRNGAVRDGPVRDIYSEIMSAQAKGQTGPQTLAFAGFNPTPLTELPPIRQHASSQANQANSQATSQYANQYVNQATNQATNQHTTQPITQHATYMSQVTRALVQYTAIGGGQPLPIKETDSETVRGHKLAYEQAKGIAAAAGIGLGRAPAVAQLPPLTDDNMGPPVVDEVPRGDLMALAPLKQQPLAYELALVLAKTLASLKLLELLQKLAATNKVTKSGSRMLVALKRLLRALVALKRNLITMKLLLTYAKLAGDTDWEYMEKLSKRTLATFAQLCDKIFNQELTADDEQELLDDEERQAREYEQLMELERRKAEAELRARRELEKHKRRQKRRLLALSKKLLILVREDDDKDNDNDKENNSDVEKDGSVAQQMPKKMPKPRANAAADASDLLSPVELEHLREETRRTTPNLARRPVLRLDPLWTAYGNNKLERAKDALDHEREAQRPALYGGKHNRRRAKETRPALAVALTRRRGLDRYRSLGPRYDGRAYDDEYELDEDRYYFDERVRGEGDERRVSGGRNGRDDRRVSSGARLARLGRRGHDDRRVSSGGRLTRSRRQTKYYLDLDDDTNLEVIDDTEDYSFEEDDGRREDARREDGRREDGRRVSGRRLEDRRRLEDQRRLDNRRLSENRRRLVDRRRLDDDYDRSYDRSDRTANRTDRHLPNHTPSDNIPRPRYDEPERKTLIALVNIPKVTRKLRCFTNSNKRLLVLLMYLTKELYRDLNLFLREEPEEPEEPEEAAEPELLEPEIEEDEDEFDDYDDGYDRRPHDDYDDLRLLRDRLRYDDDGKVMGPRRDLVYLTALRVNQRHGRNPRGPRPSSQLPLLPLTDTVGDEMDEMIPAELTRRELDDSEDYTFATTAPRRQRDAPGRPQLPIEEDEPLALDGLAVFDAIKLPTEKLKTTVDGTITPGTLKSTHLPDEPKQTVMGTGQDRQLVPPLPTMPGTISSKGVVRGPGGERVASGDRNGDRNGDRVTSNGLVVPNGLANPQPYPKVRKLMLSPQVPPNGLQKPQAAFAAAVEGSTPRLPLGLAMGLPATNATLVATPKQPLEDTTNTQPPARRSGLSFFRKLSWGLKKTVDEPARAVLEPAKTAPKSAPKGFFRWFSSHHHEPTVTKVDTTLPRAEMLLALVSLLTQWGLFGVSDVREDRVGLVIMGAVSKHNQFELKPCKFRIKVSSRGSQRSLVVCARTKGSQLTAQALFSEIEKVLVKEQVVDYNREG